MSNPPPPFGNPVYSHDDLSFPDYSVQNPLYIDEDNQISRDYLPSSLAGISEYEDLSMLFVDDEEEEEEEEEDDPLIRQLYSTQETNITKWVEEAAAVRHGHDHAVRMNDDQDKVVAEIGEGSSTTKKMDHNAKERVRRMKLNATFQALRTLLPDSRRPKKRWSGPYVIDRALEYIPQLQSQIEKLTLEKDNMVSVIEKKQLPLVTTSTDDAHHVLQNQLDNCATLTVSINEVKEGEVIIQICEHKDKAGVLTTLFDKFEGEGIQVVGASSLCASQDRTCFHVHIMMSEKPRESDYVATLHQKIISWLS
ncbi:hypothetical protein RND81_10G250600 [Saponaria officinalis]|uniref:BHLH domain-containing protein n=2 Tax=Saponaria officinalis TaxID=3572 RepID=A0AAW1I7K4_SAPOF